MRKWFQKIKEIWSNERLRALFILGLYVVLFIFLGVIFRHRAIVSKEPVVEPSNNYQYLMEIKLEEDSYTILGSQKEENTFVFNNQRYTIRDNKIYEKNGLETEDIFPIDFTKFGLEQIKIYIENSTFVMNEKIGDSIQKTYFLKNSVFESYYGKRAFEDGDITITVLENDYIQKVSMNLSSYFGTFLSITIEYEY